MSFGCGSSAKGDTCLVDDRGLMRSGSFNVWIGTCAHADAVATSIFIPVEVYEIAERVTWIRVGALVLNIAAVVYILLSKRLFGLRGGHAAYLAERHETSLLELEVAGDQSLVPSRRRALVLPPMASK
jgi:Predicted membrane protein (DUF2127)